MLILAALTLAHAAEPSETSAPPVLIEGASIATGDARITLAAPPKAAVRVGDTLTVLTADGTVEEWSLVGTPSRSGVRTAPGAVGLFVVGGRAWVEVRETRAVQVEALAPAAVAVASSQTPAAPATPIGPRARGGKVSLANAGVAVVNGAGLDVGNPVRFLRTEELEVPSAAGGVEKRLAEHEVASGIVRQVDGGNAVVDVSRGGRVRAEDRVEQRAVPGDVNFAPQRFDGFREVGGVVRPTLALGTLGAAVVADAWVTAGFEGPWYISARLSPVGLGASRDGAVTTVGALASGGYDARYLSVGLGAGWTMLTDVPGVPSYADVDIDTPGAALSFVQEARLGARDGIHLDLRNTLVLVEGYAVTEDYSGETPVYTATSTGTSFEFGGIALEGWVPTGDRADIVGAVAAGANGVFTIEAGVHSWVRGNGDTGSLGLRVAAGYAAVQGRGTQTLAGPMVSVGARYRY
jgi:hypothetical protein